MSATTILLVDDHKIFIDGLRAALEDVDGIDVVGAASDGHSAIQLTRELHPDVVIMDITMPGLNGVDATRQIRATSTATKVIALSIHSDRESISRMLNAGASGYLAKESAFVDLVEAIQVVSEGERIYLTPDINQIVMKDYVNGSSSSSSEPSPPLTSREREVLQLTAEGKSMKEIAKILHLSVRTIETHRKHIMDKLDIRDLPNLTKFAIREGLTSL